MCYLLELEHPSPRSDSVCEDFHDSEILLYKRNLQVPRGSKGETSSFWRSSVHDDRSVEHMSPDQTELTLIYLAMTSALVHYQCRPYGQQFHLISREDEPSHVCSWKCDKKRCWPMLPDHGKDVFTTTLKIWRRSSDCFQYFIANVLMHKVLDVGGVLIFTRSQRNTFGFTLSHGYLYLIKHTFHLDFLHLIKNIIDTSGYSEISTSNFRFANITRKYRLIPSWIICSLFTTQYVWKC